MAENEEDIKRIENMIAILENNLLKADPRERDALKNTVSDLRTRREEIQKRIKEREEQEQAQQRYNLEVSQAMQRETGLNSEEKSIFGKFLQKEFFTKGDLGSLGEFYARTYDRLTEEGKSQMDHRVWEGIRRDEYKFTDLQDSVKERISGGIYRDITKNSSLTSNIHGIPEQDKEDFISAYGSGDNKKAYEILDREGFKKNIAVRELNPDKNKSVEQDKGVVGQDFSSLVYKRRAEKCNSSAPSKKSFAGNDLAGIDNLASVPSTDTKAAPLPEYAGKGTQRTP